jgi:hypothetical protein
VFLKSFSASEISGFISIKVLNMIFPPLLFLC